MCLYMFRALCAHHLEVKIVLYSIWYHHTALYSVMTSVTQFVHKFCYYVPIFIELYFSNFRTLACVSVMIPDVV